MDSLFKAIRESATTAAWSRGVDLTRAQAVTRMPQKHDDEIEMRVKGRQGMVHHEVFLYPDDDDWSCECPSMEDACEHVAAAIIALRRGDKGIAGAAKTTAEKKVVHYNFEGKDGALHFSRTLKCGDEEKPLGASLTVASRERPGEFLVTHQDLEIEAMLGSYSKGALPKHVLVKLFTALMDCPRIFYQGRKIQTDSPHAGVCVVVEDSAGGFRLRLDKDPEVDELFSNGALRQDDCLAAIGEHGLDGRLYDELRRGKLYDAEDAPQLLSDVLPKLRESLSVSVRSKRLPESQRVKPRIELWTERSGTSTLAVVPQIVYGEPAIAKVVGEDLKMLTKAAVPLRDRRSEQRLRKVIDSELDLMPALRNSLPAQEAIALSEKLKFHDASQVRFAGDGHHDFYDAGNLVPDLNLGGNGGPALRFSSPKGVADPAEVLAAFERGAPLVPLLDGGFAHLPQAFLAQHAHRLRALLDAKDPSLPKDVLGAGESPWALADMAALAAESAGDGSDAPVFSGLRALLEGDFSGIAKANPPEDLKASLRPYQQEGLDWLSFLRDQSMGGILADDMGLGKTLQTLCALQGRALVVAPTSVLHNWRKEVERFRPNLGINVYHGPQRTLESNAAITLTTYAILRLDVDALAEQGWQTIVLDEAQTIKNPRSQAAQAAFRLRAPFKLALSGTPIENHLQDLWSQMNFANPGLLGSQNEFHERYVQPVNLGGRDGESALSMLRQRVAPFLLRRLKGDVAKDLPPRTDIVLRCSLDEEERGLYDTLRAAGQKEMQEKLGAGANTMEILEALLRLRQAACHPALVPGHEGPVQPSSKVKVLVKKLEEIAEEGHRALVFSQWTGFLDLVEPALGSLEHLRLDGSTRDRQAVVDSFQSANGPPVLLISLKAGSTGLNLTAADHVFLLDPWWNPAVEEQAADRAHRIGQDRPVFVHRMVAQDTVEERILELQEHKRQLAEAAVGSGGAGASLSREELLALLG